ncbi:MAG: DUF4325 domain-containing protein [Treponema sp.]|nr:DUF4325 domain-containing protein [Treponema sp.]
MPGVRKRGEEIREFILENITDNRNTAALTAERFSISLPAVYKHIDRLVSNKQLIKKAGLFVLKSIKYKYTYLINKTLREDTVWEKDIKKHFSGLPVNVWNIWVYGFMEMFNNAIDHSKGKKINVIIEENKLFTSVFIYDDGIGIFKNIMKSFDLFDEKDALLELAKGKRTTDNTRHSGQGIFFTSRVFDDFLITSNGINYNVNQNKNVQILNNKIKYSTMVYLRLAKNSNKILKNVFDQFSTEIPGDFDKTIIPVTLANSSDLVSRSQARRILSGLELFKDVTLDFNNVDYIGQAFADEIFRVFKNMYYNTIITAINTNNDTLNMINRALNTKL